MGAFVSLFAVSIVQKHEQKIVQEHEQKVCRQDDGGTWEEYEQSRLHPDEAEGLDGMNSAGVSNALLPPDMDDIKLVRSADELDGKTWVIFNPLRDEHVVAWSPCDGMKLRLPEELVADPSCGGRLVLAPNSVFTLRLDYRVVVDSRGIEAFVTYEDDHVDAVFSSITGVWELSEEEEEEEEEGGDKGGGGGGGDEEPTETMARCLKHYPLYSMPNIPTIQDRRTQELLGCHVYKGIFYAMRLHYCIPKEDRALELLRFSPESGAWEDVESHPVFGEGHPFIGGELYSMHGGGRYMMVIQGNEDDFCSGLVLVVYDLELSRWHYHTFEDVGYDISTMIICNTTPAPRGNIMDTLPAAVWSRSIDLLQLPAIPPVSPQSLA